MGVFNDAILTWLCTKVRVLYYGSISSVVRVLRRGCTMKCLIYSQDKVSMSSLEAYHVYFIVGFLITTTSVRLLWVLRKWLSFCLWVADIASLFVNHSILISTLQMNNMFMYMYVFEILNKLFVVSLWTWIIVWDANHEESLLLFQTEAHLLTIHTYIFQYRYVHISLGV